MILCFRHWLFLVLLAAIVMPQAATAADSNPDDADFAIQGEYVGHKTIDGQASRWGVQVIALGKGAFRAVAYPGGLPGDGWNEKEKRTAEGKLQDGVAVLNTADGDVIKIHDGKYEAFHSSGDQYGTLEKVSRKSPTLSAKPPAGAVVLYGGPDDVDQWKGGKASDEGWLMQGVTSNATFQSFTLHVEFLLPFMPEARGQGRGNSGCYMQGRYEVQMLDSFGLSGENNECGGVYSIAKPRINMCYPPLSWQTYDVEFTAAKFADGKKVENAHMTVRHNGILVHENLDLTHATTASPLKEGPEPGPVYLQNHGNPVRYRNIWIVAK
ncbi:MAG: DUF1080 domain-containing protein [Planctomycetales bacterium]|nr:DUF1080 domain-containing protein [Planctomycetales bacterium]